MKVTISSIRANFYEDKAAIGDMSPFITFDGDNDNKADKHGLHVAKTDVAKKAGAGEVSWDDRVELRIKSSSITVQGKASKTLLPDKVIGEGQVDIGSGGRQTVQLTDPKTGSVAGEVSFEVSTDGATGGLGGAGGVGSGMGGGQSGYGGQQSGYGGQQGVTGGQGYDSGSQGQGYGSTGTGQQSGYGGQQGVTGGQGYDSGNQGQGYGNQGNQGALTGQQQGGLTGQQGTGGQGFGQQQGGIGGGISGGAPREQYEKKGHNVHDHDESESYENRTVG
jgi:hypothetical protein